jgi:NADPH:quinone reductase-like Zn-dependent oxidoreductase
MPTNQAAWLLAKHQPLQVQDAPYTAPRGDEVLVRNRAVAVNPVDWMKPYIGDLMFRWIKYPFVLGSDLAGEVAAVGEAVTDLKVGDRVLAMAAGSCQQRARAAEGAFQAYTLVSRRLASVIPDSMSFEEAVVVPLGVTTAACGLFQSNLLALEKPTAAPPARDQWVVIWGGSTSVGSNAIQLAAAAGYSVVTTASPKNFDYVTGLGAARAFDYNSPTVIADIVAALAGKSVVGALAIGAGSEGACIDVLAQTEGRKFVASCSSPVSFETLFTGSRLTLPILLRAVMGMLRARGEVTRKSKATGVTSLFFDASSVADNEVGPAIYQDYLPAALAAGRFRPAPPPQVVGVGLDKVQAAFEAQKRGVSAAKVVVSLP